MKEWYLFYQFLFRVIPYPICMIFLDPQKCYLEWGNLLFELCNQVDQYEWRYTWFVRFGQKKESFVKSIQLDTPLSVQPNSCLKMRPRRKFGFPQVWKSWCGFPFQCLLLASYPGGEIFCFNLLTCCHWYFSSAWNIFRENNIVFHTKKLPEEIHMTAWAFLPRPASQAW